MSHQPSLVLVVEDDPLQRMLAVCAVEEAGFDALEAPTADEAIRMLESRHDIRIVFTDIEMPGTLDGLSLARAVRDRWPPISVIITSGHVIPRPDLIPPGGRFFEKPYVPEKVVSALREMAA